jgi:acyl transferase domain-containing protein/3-hydroxymyristoyl/3-hydroxydecanoyl-(acyl carrier protein) dehydratase
MMGERIAIVGIGGIFPRSPTLEQFWHNIRAGISAARPVPSGRWLLRPEDAFDSRVGTPDRVYSMHGCFIEDFSLDPRGLELDPAFVAALDPVFHLALHAGRQAWNDAVTSHVDRERVGVVIGNIALPTERANQLSRAILGTTFEEKLLGPGRSTPHIESVSRHVAGLPAALLARALGLGGGSYTLDAACASSLYALKLAADELLAGRTDAMLTGGLSRPDCLYTQMGFSQLRALSASGRCAPFDAAADGLVVGEGCGILVLKRLDDALRHGDRIYAVIAGIGLSNDVHGKLLAPSTEGQLRAMRAAYRNAGWKPWDVDIIECHGTGTPTGDAIEFESMRSLWEEGSWQRGQCVIGSVKSNVGHTLTAAGSAGLLKVLLGLREKTLPPTANFANPAPALARGDGPFRVLTQSHPWESRGKDAPRRAAVSAFGFGGINAHVLLEEFEPRAKTSSHFDRPAGRTARPEIAVVGIGAHFGKWRGLSAFRDRVLASDQQVQPTLPRFSAGVRESEWYQRSGETLPGGYFLDELRVPLDRFRIPPRELEEMLPQQLLMLLAADDALRDAGSRGSDDARLRMGVFIGIELDLNTTNFDIRWSLLERARAWNAELHLGLSESELATWAAELRDSAGAALNANRTMGALGGIVASRVAREFHVGGPSFTISSDETSGMHALEVAFRLLQQGELDQALVGAVDLAGDVRVLLATHHEQPGRVGGEGAAAVVLKRLEDAQRDGDRIYAVIRGVGGAFGSAAIRLATDRATADANIDAATIDLPSAEREIGRAGAAAGLASFVKACLCLHHRLLPDPDGVQYWLKDRADGPRRAGISVESFDGNHHRVIVEEGPQAPLPERIRVADSLIGLSGRDLAELRTALRRLLEQAESKSPSALAREHAHAPAGSPHRLALLARDRDELKRLCQAAESWLTNHPDISPAGIRDPLLERIFYAPEWTGTRPRLAFVFPGSGNHFPGMGRDLSATWPHVLERQHGENQLLRSQIAPDVFWNRDELASVHDHRLLILGQVALGTLISDILQDCGVRPDAVIGYSLGETAGLFALRAWTDRDEMLRRMLTSPLFERELAGPCEAARRAWKLPANEPVHWVAGVVDVAAEVVRAQLAGRTRVYLLIVNTPKEAVIGGTRRAVEALVRDLSCRFLPLAGVSTVHCEIAREVEADYHALHLLPTTPPPGIEFYSGAWGRRFDLTRENAAESILAGATAGVDFPAVVRQAYDDGIRLFVEIGPGNSCSRMIGQILEGRPHLARSACVAGQDNVGTMLRLLGQLFAAGAAVDLAKLYPSTDDGQNVAEERTLLVPVGIKPFQVPPRPPARTKHEPALAVQRHNELSPRTSVASHPVLAQMTATGAAKADAHAAFLRFSQNLVQSVTGQMAFQMSLMERGGVDLPTFIRNAQASAAATLSMESRLDGSSKNVPVALDRRQCLEFAVGALGNVLGPDFAEVDRFPTRVRLPDEPLMLVDRILSITGEPRSLSSGRVVTEHDIHPGAWYLDGGRIPTCIAVEAGQADLFLSGYLGIDFQTHGLARYRLLDAVVTFHRGLPGPGEIIRYDIRIDHFFRQGDTYLFRFNFEGTVNGEPLLTMKNGCAGFFTAEELGSGRGIVQTELDRRPRPGIRPDDWRDLVPMAVEAYDEQQVESLRGGDLAGCFGQHFAGLALKQPLRLPTGRMLLVHRVAQLDPQGGRFGLGLIRAEADIHPGDWFLTCHFVDDQVMPGTLMYECCLHTLRILLSRMGWVGEHDEIVCEPVPGVASRLKCRGQVIESTRTVTYEVWLKEIGYRPEPYAIADALMYADGKPIVEITDMSLRLTGLTREKVEALWNEASGERKRLEAATHATPPPVAYAPGSRKPLMDRAGILAFAVGNPSEAFGDRYGMFDQERFLARLPGEPFAFIDRVMSSTATPWQMESGGTAEAEYDVSPDAWYFPANRQPRMPFAVLNEIALQPCGWLAAYIGSALTSPDDLHFRNLGGSAVQHVEVPPDIGTLSTSVRVTRVSNSAGMIIQNYDLVIRAGSRVVYEGDTYFGYFTTAALAQQIGIRDAKIHRPDAAEAARGRSFAFPDSAVLPAPPLRMLDRIDLLVPDGGPQRLGYIEGSKIINPEEWFFKAHFYQDPVWPGSLGLEALLQLLKVFAVERWGATAFAAQQIDVPHRWVYRGQVIPTDRRVSVQAWVTGVNEQSETLQADGVLAVDGRVIYQMTGFSLGWRKSV